ncbi:MAG: c-type cytochrome [Candidatus Solibacter usitatus]|nr:c-type cytochrome [Candidatus Solibacter usitatus]
MSIRKLFRLIPSFALAALLAACGGSKPPAEEPKAPPTPARPIGAAITIQAPLGLPAVPAPADNPATAETIALGRRLYYDKALSIDNTVACASCHDPKFGFTDGKQFSEGVKGQKGDRNAPTVFNAAYATVQFWDGRAPSLEKQAEGPVANPIEMGHTLEGVEKKLSADPSYKAEFEKAYGPGPITYEKVEKAIASFERTVISGNSPFDKFMYGGDKKALSPAAQRGLAIFRDAKKGNCAVCHTIEEKSALFTDNKFHNIGVGVDTKGELTDLGRFKVTKAEADRGAFRTPSLRNIALTGPYMHNGSLKTLKEVVDFYVGGGSSNPQLDKEIKSLDHLTKKERADLEEFLKALTGEIPANVGPPEAR